MEISEKVVNAVLIHTCAPAPSHKHTAQLLADCLLAEYNAVSLSQTHIHDESEVSTLIDSLQAGGPTPGTAQVQSNVGNTSANSQTCPLIIVSRMNLATDEKALSRAQSLLHKTAAFAENANVPVIAIQIGSQQISQTTVSNGNQNSKTATIKLAGNNRAKFRTITIRDDYRHHDVALLARQCFSLLNITLTEDSALSTYPNAPEKPGGSVTLDPPTLMQTVAHDTPDWQLQTIVDDTTSKAGTSEITRNLRFRSFQSAIRFMHQVAPACDIANHHPRWENNWRDLRIWLTTWDADQQITDRDLQLARYFDDVYTRYGYASH